MELGHSKFFSIGKSKKLKEELNYDGQNKLYG